MSHFKITMYKKILLFLSFNSQFIIASDSNTMIPMPIDSKQNERYSRLGNVLTGNNQPQTNNDGLNSNDHDTTIPGAFGYTWAWNSQKTNLKATFFVITASQNNNKEYSTIKRNMAFSSGNVANLNVTDELNKHLNLREFQYPIKPTKIIIKQSLLSDLYDRYMITFCIRKEILVDQARYPIDLEEEDLFLMMDVQNPQSYINQYTRPKDIFHKVTKVVYHNGWYTEKILRYDNEKKPTIRSTWQHKTYIFCKSSAIALFLYATYFLFQKHW